MPRFFLSCAALLGLCGASAAAQDVVSQPVVQALPSAEVQRLNRALLALARSPRDRDALLEAGQAALGVDDLEAAIGFFGRAAEVDPGHPGAAKGLGGVYLRAGRAADALIQFDRALAGGVDDREVLADQALAFDLVGNQTAAQAGYVRALTADPAHSEARRRLAVSYAISGNRPRFEETLRPLLDQRDVAAQRARAFGLAILGDTERAGAIVEQVMPRDLAVRLVPYLGFMPRLTKPQQAAAANLGIFPRAADIGREDPRLARFAQEERADSRLAPAGPPLGTSAPSRPVAAAAPTAKSRAKDRRKDREKGKAITAPPPTEARAAARAGPVAGPAPAPAGAPRQGGDMTPTPAPMPAPALAPVLAQAPAPQPLPAVATVTAAPPAPTPAPAVQAPAPAPAPSPRVSDAFADLGSAPLPDARPSGDAVDLSRIAVKREPPPEKPKPKEPPKEPAKPVHPSRIWVQVATGKDVKALGFDWRRITRAGGDAVGALKPHTTRWGASNRLLAGPIDNRDKAQALVKALNAKGLDSFLYLSPEGEEIQLLK